MLGREFDKERNVKGVAGAKVGEEGGGYILCRQLLLKGRLKHYTTLSLTSFKFRI